MMCSAAPVVAGLADATASSSVPSCSGRDAAGHEPAIRCELAALQSRIHRKQGGLGRLFFPEWSEDKRTVAGVLALAASTAQGRLWADVPRAAWTELCRIMQRHSQRDGSAGEGASAPDGDARMDLLGLRMDYDGFEAVGRDFARHLGCDDVRATLFQPRVFLRFRRDERGAAPTAAIMDYLFGLGRRLGVLQAARALDRDGDDFLTAEELGTALEHIAGSAMLDLDKPRAATWRTIAPRMLLFHHGRNGKVDVVDLVTHEGLEDYLALFPDDRLDADPGMDWFCAQKASAVHDKFRELDSDGDGMLLPHELRLVRSAPDTRRCSMVDYFVTRVFEVHVRSVSPLTGAPAMNLAEFADFLLAWNFRGKPPSVRYFFRALDLEQKGYLSARVVETWCEHVARVAVDELGLVCEYTPADVKDEIFDMLRLAVPGRITLAELCESDLGDLICGMLVDAQVFSDYENRESEGQAQADYE